MLVSNSQPQILKVCHNQVYTLHACIYFALELPRGLKRQCPDEREHQNGLPSKKLKSKNEMESDAGIYNLFSQ